MNMEKLRLGELVVFQRGFDITKKEQTDGEVPVISSGGISSYHNTHRVEGPGVVIGRKGTLGTVFYSEVDYWPHDTALWVKDFKNNDPLFVYYYLKTLGLERFDAGAANPTLNRNHIHSLKVWVPEIANRTKIADILSAYDELIDNNNQRISLLEQMAEEMYKEWFVRLRFAGHEQTRIVDGVPEGWEKVTLGKLINVKKGKNITKNTVNEGSVPVVAGGLKPSCYHDKPNAKGPVITVSSSGANSGYVNLYQQNIWASDCSYINKDVTDKIYYFYTLLKLRQTEIYNLQHGSAQPHVYPKDLERLEVIQPAEQLICEFEESIGEFYRLRKILKEKNKILKQTRDLLLPRLMSGKLSVDHLLSSVL